MSQEFRDRVGRRVREVWLAWARTQPDPKPSWLLPWEELTEPEREADRCIGAALWGDGFSAGVDAAGQAQEAVVALTPDQKADLGD